MSKKCPMTITEQILAVHGNKREVHPGELVDVHVDVALGNDISGPMAIEAFKKMGAKRVFRRDRLILIADHMTPAKDVRSAENCRILKNFAMTHGLTHFFEGGQVGIEHTLLPEKGLVLPGDVVVGGDSHTCTYGALGAFSTGVGSSDLAAVMATGRLWFKVPETIKFVFRGKLNRWVSGKDLILYVIGDIGVDGALYKAIEFCGEIIDKLPMSSRLTMANMVIEAGAKNGIFKPDKITLGYVKSRSQRPYRIYQGDLQAKYIEMREYDVSKLQPQVSLPHIPSNTKDVREVGQIYLDQVVIGSCTNGHLDDLRVAAGILKGKKVAPSLRLIIIPATPEIYSQALKEGLIGIFVDAGAIVSPPTCGPCFGGHMGILARGEKALATTNRNFRGRMGDAQSEVYLSGPAVAAASAVKGKICHPEEMERR
jgi:3-isopropylmalate/(R)-2-methylmalate dehydratase large subunit